MHELSIAQSIIEIVEEEAIKNDLHTISVVEVEVGALSSIEPDALEFAWEVASQEGIVKGSTLKITRVRAFAKCSECGHEFEVETFYEVCPRCGNTWFDVIRGKEMRITGIISE